MRVAFSDSSGTHSDVKWNTLSKTREPVSWEIEELLLESKGRP